MAQGLQGEALELQLCFAVGHGLELVNVLRVGHNGCHLDGLVCMVGDSRLWEDGNWVFVVAG